MKIKHPLLLRIFLSIIILSVMGVLVFFSSRSVLKTLYPLKYTEFVEVYSKENNLSEDFVYAVIKCESSFKPDAVSYVGARGLMQIMPDTFDWIKGRLKDTIEYDDMFSAEYNIRYGCHLYGYLMEKYESEKLAVAAYHAGMGNVDKWLSDEEYSSDGKSLDDIPFPSTKKYVTKVIETKKIYQKLYK
ncbi:MAG: lytic transglycosylase domain-containing protein [Clostridia bacterium]|nr:lytic transglycosylase domain-containing protein [Clostridia bacterium]